MTSKVYMLPEAVITFKPSGGTVAFSVQNLAAGAGRQSAVYDFDTLARPYVFNWRAYTKFATQPVLGDTVDIYIKTSDGSHPDNDDGLLDAAMSTITSSVDKTKNLTKIGSIVVDEATATPGTVEFVGSGVVTLTHRYVQIVWVNRTADALSNTQSDHGMILEPVAVQGQDT